MFQNNEIYSGSLKTPNQLIEAEAKIELKRLKLSLEYHNKLYYQENNTAIPDSEYDQIFQRYLKIEELFPHLIVADSPTQVITPIVSKFTKITHSKPMLSLGNAFNEEDVIDFIQRVQRFLGINYFPDICCETKIDGLSFSARFENGELIHAATRGDGYIGEDITKNIKQVHDFPHSIDIKDVVEVRGEVYMTHKDFYNLNNKQQEIGEDLFSNPRNAAAGSLRQLDSNTTAERKLHYFVYSVGEMKLNNLETQKNLLDFFIACGFSVNPQHRICTNLSQIIEFYQEIEQVRSALSFDIDGMVYKVNNLQLQDRLGFAGRNPRWAIAHKFKAEQATTYLKSIMVQVGRTGALTPVAELEPINIGGVLVSRASLHNQDEIDRKDIRIGDSVIIQRAGDVIPQVVEVNLDLRVEESTKFYLPKNCPSCGSKVMREVDEAVIRCPSGLNCPAQALEHLCHFVSKNAFDIDGLGEKQLEFLLNESYIKSPDSIFKLNELSEKLQEHLRFGEKSVANLLESIDKAKDVSLARFIYSLGIRSIGSVTAKLFAKNYYNFSDWFLAMKEISKNNPIAEDQLNNIDGIGNKTIFMIKEFFSDEVNCQIIERINEVVNISDFIETDVKSIYAGKTIVFTGGLNQMTRVEAKSKAEDLGMKVMSSISKNLDYVIVGKDAGSKLTKAQDLGLRILSEKEWVLMSTYNSNS